MNKLLISIVLLSFSISGFSKEINDKGIPKGTLSIGLQPAFKANKSKIGVGGNTTTSQFGLNLPVKYYVAKNVGIQANIGLVFNGEKSDFGNGNVTNNTSGLQLGLGIVKPVILIAFLKGGRFVLTPQIQTNFLTGEKKRTTPNTVTKNDVQGFQVGAWLGAEWFTKSIGVPQLALQAVVGLVGFNQSDVGGSESENTWVFSPSSQQAGSLNFLNATFGFHYYFF